MVNDKPGKIKPGGLTGIAEVIGTIGCANGVSKQVHGDCHQGGAEISRPGGAPVLIGDDSQLFSFAGQTPDRSYETAALDAIEPGGPHNEMFRQVGANGLLALPLAVAIDIDRIGRIIFFIRVAGLAVKDIIGGNVDEGKMMSAARYRKVFRATTVDGKGELGLRFCFVDGGIGGAVDHQSRLVIPKRGINLGCAGDIDFLQIESNRRDTA